MSIPIRVYPPMLPTRPCRFCLCFHDCSVFADFDVAADGRVILRRISFDGYGCCHAKFKKMHLADSLILIEAVERKAVETPTIEMILLRYFRENSDLIWKDALQTHSLL